MTSKLGGTRIRNEFSFNSNSKLDADPSSAKVPRRVRNRRKHLVSNAVMLLEKRMLYTASTYFTPGDIAVEVLGSSGGSTASTTTVPVSIQEFNGFTQGQSPVMQINLPSGSTVTGSTHDLTDFFPTSATYSNGFMSRTTDGNSLVLVGYNAATGSPNTIQTGSSSTTLRTIAVVSANGSVDTSTTFGGAAAPSLNLGVHGIASNDGNEFWVAGNGASGSISPLLYVASKGASTATPVANFNANGTSGATTNFRAVGFYGGQLYVSAGTNPIYGEATVGNVSGGAVSEPTGSTGTQPAYVLPAMGGNPGNGSQFVFLNSTTVYNADPSGGMQKWVLTGGQWVLQYGGDVPAPATATSSDTSMQGLTIGPSIGGYVTLYGTTSGTSQNRLMQIVDTGSGFTFTTLATALAGEVFKGVAMTPAGAGITSISAAPATVNSGTVTLTATAATTQTASILSSQATLPYSYPVGTVSSVSFFQQPAVNTSAGTQSSSDLFLGNGVYNSTSGQWVLANASFNNSGGLGTYSFYAIASETIASGELYPNAVTGTGSGTTSGVGAGVGVEPTATVLYSSYVTPTVGGVSTNVSSVAIDGTVQFTASGVVAAPGDTGTTGVLFDAVGGGGTYYLGQANASTGYVLTYSPSQYAITNSSGNVLSGLPQGTAYNIVAYANSSTGVESPPATDYGALSVTTPTISFNQSSYNVSSSASSTTVTLYGTRTDYLNTASSVTWTTSGVGATGSQVNASSGTFYGTSGSTAELTGTAYFAMGSNTSTPITITILPTPANQISTGVFEVIFTAPNVSSGAITATTAKLGSTNPAKVDILVSTETFNLSSPVVTVNAANDSSGYLYFTVNRNGYLGDAVTLNASTYTLTSGLAASMVQSNTGTGVGTVAGAGSDYTALSNYQVNFNVGQSAATIPVPFFDTTNYNCSFGISISGIAGGQNGTTKANGYSVLSGQNTSIGTILTPILNSTLSSKPATATDVEVASLYAPQAFPVVGDGSGSGNFNYLNYEVLEFSPTLSPNIYPAAGTNISSGASISSLSLSLYNTDANPGDAYNGHVGDFNLYYIAATENSQPTGGFLFSNNSTSYPTGFTLSASSPSSNAYFLGSFSFSDTAGYDTFTVLRGNGLNTSSGNFATAAFNSIAGALNTQSNFRLAITPADQGVGAMDAEWAGISQAATPPVVSLNAATNKTATAEYFSFAQGSYAVNQNAGTATITVIRSQTPGGPAYAFADNNASVTVSVSSASAILGTDYNVSSPQTLTFPAGVSSEQFTVQIDPNGQVVTQGGDKQVVFSLSSPTNGSTGGYQTAVGTNLNTVLSITDNKDAPGNNTSFQTLTYYSDVASVVEAVGPYYTTQFSVGGSTPPSGGYASYGAASFEDGGIVQVNGNSVSNTVTPSNPITAINGITLDVYNLGGGASGPIDVYFFNNSNSNIVPSIYPAAGSYYNPATYRYSDPHFFNFEYTEGLDHNPADTQSFGTPLLLGTINWNSSIAPGFTPLTLASYNSAIAAIVISDLNSGSPFQIAATPENSTVYAAWGGSTAYSTDANGNIITQAPYLTFNVTESLPPWLAPNSVATWNATSQSLVVSGPTSIIANPGADEPNITFVGSGATLTFNTSSATAIDIGSLAMSHGANIVVNSPPSGVDTLVIAAPNASAGTLGFSTDGTGRLNLGSNDMIVQQGNVSAVLGAVKSGYGNGTWNGATGIYSSAAAGNSAHIMALGAVVDDGSIPNFEGVSTSAGDILIKYTYYGDADLSGTVDGSDYSRIDYAYTHPGTLSGWFNGDFNYDSVIDGSDYTLIDNAFNTQGGNIAAEIATPTAVIATATSKTSTKNGIVLSQTAATAAASNNIFSQKKLKQSLADLVLSDLVTGN